MDYHSYIQALCSAQLFSEWARTHPHTLPDKSGKDELRRDAKAWAARHALGDVEADVAGCWRHVQAAPCVPAPLSHPSLIAQRATLQQRGQVVRKASSAPTGTQTSAPLSVTYMTWNMNAVVRGLDEWKRILGGRAWRQTLIDPRPAILAVALQEVNSKDALVKALPAAVEAAAPGAYTHFASRLTSLASPKFGQALLVWVARDAVAGKTQVHKPCFGAVGTCVKGSIIMNVPVWASFGGDGGGRRAAKNVVLVASHLPFDPKAADLGLSKRTSAFSQTRKAMCALLKAPHQGDASVVFWAGDLNYRKTPDGGDQLTQALARGALPYRGFSEAPIRFDPTCKLKQCSDGSCPVCRNAPGSKTRACYDVTREPSHCDRVLYAVMPCAPPEAPQPAAALVTNQVYTTLVDPASAITSRSDHDAVMARFRVVFQ